jgi:CubicO group peptidase (beta-lactamase class C family)
MKDKMNELILDGLVNDAVSRKYIYGAVFYVSSDDNSIDLISASGNMKKDSKYHIASINKFFVSALILKLCMEDKLDLQDKISRYLSEETVQNLHQYKGKDYSNSLTIAHLMSLTSGLPCYLMDKQANGKIAMNELEAGIDQAWPIDKVIKEVKRMKTHFPPGKEGRARYADTNHQILGLILQNITGEPVNIMLNNLFRELNMMRTYVFDDTDDQNFVPIRYKSKVIDIPLFLTSTQNDIISTVMDQMTFIKAFFSGNFFPKNRLHELEKWNDIFFPFKYGIGVQKFHLPRMLSPFHPVPDMVGHCGSTGSVVFYVPDMDLYITGTTNQQTRPSIAFQTVIKIINKFKQ